MLCGILLLVSGSLAVCDALLRISRYWTVCDVFLHARGCCM